MDPSASLSAPHAIRKMIKDGDYTGPTKGFVPGFTQCNVIILPQSEAYSFFRFCESNQSVCKLIIPPSEPGNFNFDTLGKDIDDSLPPPQVSDFKAWPARPRMP